MFDPLRAYEKIRKYPVVSFDIFDTLVKRNVSNPKGIFNVVEKKLNLRHPEAKIHDFCAMRVQAEQEARRF